MVVSGMVIRACSYSKFHMNEEELRKLSSIGVYYGFNNYKRTIYQLNELADIIRSEVNLVDVYDMEVYEITRAQSCRYAGHTMIYFNMPVETFINLRNEGKLNSL